MRRMLESLFRKPKPAPIETAPIPPDLHVGDMVEHPFQDKSTPILYIGDEIVKFVKPADQRSLAAGRGGLIGYEVIKGSPAYYELKNDRRYTESAAHARRELSAEIDMTTDIEKRTLVVPLSKLKKI